MAKADGDAEHFSAGRFSVSSALDPKIRIYIFMQRSHVRGSSRRRRRRPNPRIVCNGIFTPFEASIPFTLAAVLLFPFTLCGRNCPGVSTSASYLQVFDLKVPSRLCQNLTLHFPRLLNNFLNY